MTRPTLYLLAPSFPDPKVGDALYFCPHCATIAGVLAFYPALRDRLEVRQVDFPRPRKDIVAELGEANQACPVLVLPRDWTGPAPDGRRANGRIFFVGADEIARFLAQWAGTGLPHP